MFYSELALDRAGARRSDPTWVATARADPTASLIPLWRQSCLTRDGIPVTLSGRPAATLYDALRAGPQPAADRSALLGLDGSAPVFAADLSDLDEAAARNLTGADGIADVRELIATIEQSQAGVLAYARGLLHWNRHQRFCGACGGPTEQRDGGHVRYCPACDRLLFPKIEPAVIMLVESPGPPRRCLLGRHRASDADRFSTLAGFVEIGESLEDTVRREVAEEAGVRVGEVSYQASQAWPFPAGLMVGFRAEALSTDISPDGDEVLEARWFTAAELRARIADPALGGPYRADSIGHLMIQSWLADADPR